MFVTVAAGAIGFLNSMSTEQSGGITKSSKLALQPEEGGGGRALALKELPAGSTFRLKRSRVARLTAFAASLTSASLNKSTGWMFRCGLKVQVKSSVNVPPSFLKGLGRSSS